MEIWIPLSQALLVSIISYWDNHKEGEFGGTYGWLA